MRARTSAQSAPDRPHIRAPTHRRRYTVHRLHRPAPDASVGRGRTCRHWPAAVRSARCFGRSRRLADRVQADDPGGLGLAIHVDPPRAKPSCSRQPRTTPARSGSLAVSNNRSRFRRNEAVSSGAAAATTSTTRRTTVGTRSATVTDDSPIRRRSAAGSRRSCVVAITTCAPMANGTSIWRIDEENGADAVSR